MITRLHPTTLQTAWQERPLPGSGTQADPFDWPSNATVSGSDSTLPIAIVEEWGVTTVYAVVRLQASTLYTWSISGMSGMDTQAWLYSGETEVAEYVYDWEYDTWTMTYTPSVTGDYLFKIGAFSMGGAMSVSMTPVPTAQTPWVERSAGALSMAGVDAYGRLVRYRSAGDAGLGTSMFLASKAWLMLPLDGALTDLGRNARTDLVTTGGWTAEGKFSGAATWDGQAIVIPYADNPFAGDFTVQCWVKLNGSGRMAVMALADDQYIGIDNNTGKWCMWAGAGSWSILQGDTNDSDPTGSSGIGTIDATTGVWTHLAYVHYGDQWVLFVDGVEARRKTRSGTIAYANKAIRIGRWGGDIFGSNLSIDEFRIDTRALWTEAFTPPVAAYK